MALKDSKLEEKEQLVIKGTIFADEFRNRETGEEYSGGGGTPEDVYTKEETNALLEEKQDVLTFDNTPTENSTNPVASGGVYTALLEKENKLSASTVEDGSVDKILAFDSQGNLVKANAPQGTVIVDGELSSASENPVQNKVITGKFDSMFSSSKNLLKITDILTTGYNNAYSNGIFVANESSISILTDFIKVEEEESYSFAGFFYRIASNTQYPIEEQTICIYNGNKQFIRDTGMGRNETFHTVTIGSGEVYIRCFWKISFTTSIYEGMTTQQARNYLAAHSMLWKGNSFVDFETFYDDFKYSKPEGENAMDLFVRTKNLCDNSKNISGYSGAISSSQYKWGLGYSTFGNYGTQCTTTQLIRVYVGKTYAISHLGSRQDRFQIVYSDDLSGLIGTLIFPEGTNNYIILEADHDGYIVVSSWVTDDKFQVEEGDTPTNFVEYGYVFNPELLHSVADNPYKDKKLYIFGDSIMAASGTGVKGVGEQLKEKYGMVLINYAIDGKLITNKDSYLPDTILNEINNASADVPDYIIWNGGTNDLSSWDSITKGGISTGYSATLDDSTFCGAFEKTIKTLMTKYPGARIIYCTTHVNAGRDGVGGVGLVNQNEIWDLTRQICKKWGMQVADIWKDSGLNSYLTEYKGVYTDAGGTHPNTLGYEKFYLPVIEDVM